MEDNWNLVQNMNLQKNTQYLIFMEKLRNICVSYLKKKYCNTSWVHSIKFQSSMIDKSIDDSKYIDIQTLNLCLAKLSPADAVTINGWWYNKCIMQCSCCDMHT